MSILTTKNIIFAQLKSSFSCLPARIIKNIEIAKNFINENKSTSEIEQSIYKHTGILQRRYAHNNDLW